MVFGADKVETFLLYHLVQDLNIHNTFSKLLFKLHNRHVITIPFVSPFTWLQLGFKHIIYRCFLAPALLERVLVIDETALKVEQFHEVISKLLTYHR